MDMDVDTKVLQCLQADLRKCKNQLTSAAQELTIAVTSAGQSLEGKQYSLSVEETAASCEIIKASSDNLQALISHLSRLEIAVQEYLKCKYQG